MSGGSVHAVKTLAARQRDTLRLIQEFFTRNDEPPSVAWLARRLGISRQATQLHVDALFRKGWLSTPSPAGLRCSHAPAAPRSAGRSTA